MKNLLFISAMIVLFCSTDLFAQEDIKRENVEEIQAQRKKFYQRELQFSEAEAKAFWPIFESHQDKMKQLKNRKNRPKLELMTDSEAEAYLDTYIEKEEQILAARKKMIQSLKGKIGVRKIAALPHVEGKFKKALLRFYKREHGGEQGKGRFEGERRGGGKKRFK